MHPKNLIEGLARLRALGLPEDVADPVLTLWSNSERGHLHLDQHCKSLDSTRALTQDLRLGNLKAGRLCASCADIALRANHRELSDLLDETSVLAEADELFKQYNRQPWQSLMVARSLRALQQRHQLQESTNVTGYDLWRLVQTMLEGLSQLAYTTARDEQVDASLLRNLGCTNLQRRSNDVLSEVDQRLFPSGGPGSLFSLFVLWCERFAATGDLEYTRQRVRSELREHTRLVSLNQLAYCPEESVPADQTLGQFVKDSWQKMIDLTIDRLLHQWEIITMEEIGLNEADHVLGFRCALTPDDLLTAVIERYEVASDSDYHVVRAPAVVIRWLAGEHENDVVIKDLTDYPAIVDDLTVKTALTLFERGANTYRNIDEALSAAKRL